MKKYFIPMMFLFAVAAGMSVTSCDDKKDAETKYTAEQQQNKLDATGEAFIQELDLANWQSTVDLAVPGIMVLEEMEFDEEYEPEIETRTYDIDNAKKICHRTYQIDMTRIKGHFTVDDDMIATPVEGDFNDFQLSFTADEHAYVVDVKFTNSKKNVLMDTYEDTTSGYYDEDNEWQNFEERYALDSKTFLVLPEKLEAYFTVDGSKSFSLVGTLTYDGPDDLSEMPDFKTLSVKVGFALNAGGYSMSLDQLSYNKGAAKEVFALKRNKKLLLEITSSATGLGLAEEEEVVGVKSPEDGTPEVDGGYEGYDEEDSALETLTMIQCEKAELAIDVLGQVQVKGYIKYNALIEKYLDMPAIESQEAAAAWLATLKPYYDLSLYYDHGNSPQATIVPAVVDQKGIVPSIVFADGTSYAVEEFFTEDNFTKTVAALQALVTSVNEYFDSFSAGEDSVVTEEQPK